MTSGGDTDGMEYEYDEIKAESGDIADEDDDVDMGGGGDVDLNENDPDPSAGGSDVGGRAGDPNAVEDAAEGDVRGDDQHEVGGGQTGMGKGPTGS
jgi:hypothetical protein